MRRFIVLFVILIAGLMASPALDGDAFTIADLWFPGGRGSYWVYDVPSLERQVTVTVCEDRVIGGKRYKALRETEQFIGTLAAVIGTGEAVEPDPFLLFRQDGIDTMRGYGKAANQAFERALQELFAAAGVPKGNLRMEFSDDEWSILEVKEDQDWTLIRIDVEARLLDTKIHGTFEVSGTAPWMTEVATEAGEFSAVCTDYLLISDIEGEVEKLRLCRMWLALEVGLVQLQVGEDICPLVEYHITDPTPAQNEAVESARKLATTWARLKG